MFETFTQWISAPGMWNDGIVVLGLMMVAGLAYLIFSKE